MKQIKQLLVSILITFSICSYISAQGGLSVETAVIATFDTNNIADASEVVQIYYFTPDFNGFVAIGNCGLTGLDTEVWIYDSLDVLIGTNDYYCDYQTHLVIPVDSSMRYYVHWALFEGTAQETYNWYLTEIQPEPGELCISTISAVEGINHVSIPEVGNQWFEYTVATEAKIMISVNPEVVEKIENWDIQFYYDCTYREADFHETDETALAFIADSPGDYKILFNRYNLGDTTEFDWTLWEEEILPGESCSEAILADTGINTFYSGRLPELYYSFEVPDDGKIEIDLCNIPEGIDASCEVYTGDCDNLINKNDVDLFYCSSGNNYHTTFYADSGSSYLFKIYSEYDTTFEWEIKLTESYPGEYYHSAIPVTIGDTIEISSVNNSRKTWYNFLADKNKMISVSTCELGNGPWDISSITVYKDTLNLYYPEWFIWDNNCSNGKYFEFSADSGSLYYIRFSHKNDITSAKWTINERNFEAGEICDSSILVDNGVVYKIPSEKGNYWYKYTPVENEYKVIGGISVEQFAGLFIKEDCDCEPGYGATSGCIACDNIGGIVLLLEAGKTYHIGWQNFYFQEFAWSIYDPTDILNFSVENQIESTVIDHDNHTINITVGESASVTNLTQHFTLAEGIEYIANGEIQYSGSQQDFTNPLTYTIRYINPDKSETLTQDWIVTVTNYQAPPAGSYTVKSIYLKDPDLAKSLVSDWADFWKSAYDTEHGGFFSFVDQEGNPTDDIKTIISQTQNAYAFARAFMVTGDTSYLNHANRALQFMYDYYWDVTNGGWYVIVDANGDISESYENTYKYSFFQHYANLGMVAMADATAGSRFNIQEISSTAFNEHIHWEMLNNSLDVINENLWDDRSNYYGYYYEADLDWSNPRDKGFTPTVDGITTHGLYMYLLTKDPFFYTRLEQLANNIEEHMIPEMESAEIGFPEDYNSDWGQPSNLHFIGHMYKTAWCLARAYLVNPRERYREAAKVLMYDLLNNGAYDFTHGGPCFVNDEPVTKLFWEVEQAYTSGMMNYYISNDEDDKNRFIEVADGTIDFFMNNFVDTEYGEVYELTDKEGNVMSAQKGHFDKAGYHSTEFVYYAYLYGNLFYKEEPVELYYFIDASNEAQTVSLYPLAIEDNYLKIDAVELNGNAFNTYDKDTRTLNIAANQGGIFKVTFSNCKNNDVYAPFANTPDNLNVKVYPNPVISSSVIEYNVDTYTDVTINIIDITGKVIYSIENKNVSPGIYQEIIHRNQIAGNNICFIKAKTNTQSKIIKLIKI
jgi:mannose/cellobiose epimerase-like protein (N-acyl-D-glucosamine 2-epimerase family)